jgi:Spy/CpxP family protein refolding chaperone
MTMMTAMTKILTSALFGLTLLTAGSADAKRADGDRQGRGEKVCERLACSDAQKAQIKQIREVVKTKVAGEKTAIRELRKQIAAEYRKDKLDQARLGDLYRQLDARRSTVESARRAAKAQIHGLLTPEQRTKFAAEKQGAGKKHGKKHAKARGFGKRGTSRGV